MQKRKRKNMYNNHEYGYKTYVILVLKTGT